MGSSYKSVYLAAFVSLKKINAVILYGIHITPEGQGGLLMARVASIFNKAKKKHARYLVFVSFL